MRRFKVFSFAATEEFIADAEQKINEFLRDSNAVDPQITTVTCCGKNDYDHSYVNITVTIVY